MPDVTPIVLQQIDLDIVPGKIPPIVHVSEYDTGRQILVNLFRDGYPFGSNSIESYTVKVEGSIGKYGFSENAAWADDAEGVVVVHLTEAMTAIHGRVWTKIKLIKSESMQISTCGFWLDCDRAGVEAETVIGAPGFQEQINEGIAEYFDNDPPFFELPEGGEEGQALISDGEGGAEWGSAGVDLDTTLTQAGKAADAAATGMRINSISTSGSGLTGSQIAAIAALFQLAVYAEDPSDAFDAFIAAFPIYQDGSVLTIIGGVTASLSGSALTLS